MRMRQFVIVWVAGLMMGSGAGLIVARSLPSAAETGSTVRVEDRTDPHSGRPASLFDPQQYPQFSPALEAPALPLQKISVPDEPRLFPEGEASPVTQKPTSPAATTPAAAPAGSQTNLSGFRQELQELAPELNEESLDELERIRAAIETDGADLSHSLQQSAASSTPSSAEALPAEKIESPASSVKEENVP